MTAVSFTKRIFVLSGSVAQTRNKIFQSLRVETMSNLIIQSSQVAMLDGIYYLPIEAILNSFVLDELLNLSNSSIQDLSLGPLVPHSAQHLGNDAFRQLSLLTFLCLLLKAHPAV